MRVDRRGFTLVEVTLALALSGLVLGGAVGLLFASSETQRRIAEDAERQYERFVRQDFAATLLARFEPNVQSLDWFQGRPRAMQFRSRCERAGGWLSLCDVRLEMAADEHGGIALVVSIDAAPPERLRTLPMHARFLYRVSGVNGHAWSSAWDSGAAAPDAVAIVSAADTLLLALGPGR